MEALFSNNVSFSGSDFMEMQKFMVEPVAEWSFNQMLLFPWLFIIPAEILGFISSTLIFFLGGKNDLPHGKTTGVALPFKYDWFYITFNRLVMLPLISWMIVRTVWGSNAVVYDMEKLDWFNGLVMFVVVFSLSDFTYYASHRIVHKVPFLYKYIHKHHHGESEPIRGWADTCNATPLDFFYTGFCTSPMSVLWLMPKNSVHIVAIGLCLWVNSFVGSLGHCRLDLNWGAFNTRFHAGHHGYSKCNFAQNIELWDRIFGTFRDYGETVERKKNLKGE
jgi:sterol desaturase/sphingolipid hydroxylase (fatty acid hydroxylase superfamily)